MEIQAYGTKVMIKAAKQAEATESGIVLKEYVNKEPVLKFVVCSVSDKIEDIVVGDFVYVEKKQLKVATSVGEDCLFVDYANILAVESVE